VTFIAGRSGGDGDLDGRISRIDSIGELVMNRIDDVVTFPTGGSPGGE
jgi:hypothetical protein